VGNLFGKQPLGSQRKAGRIILRCVLEKWILTTAGKWYELMMASNGGYGISHI
jgi:hypothetical protein